MPAKTTKPEHAGSAAHDAQQLEALPAAVAMLPVSVPPTSSLSASGPEKAPSQALDADGGAGPSRLSVIALVLSSAIPCAASACLSEKLGNLRKGLAELTGNNGNISVSADKLVEPLSEP